MESQTAHDFLSALKHSRLLSVEQVAQLIEDHPLDDFPSAESLASRLVEECRLTRYQAGQLLKGQHRRLRIGRYRVLRPLADGGMSALFLAEDSESGERRALKVLSQELGEDAGMLARFKLEVRAGTLLHHPNLVHTLETGQAGHAYYAVMEFFEAINIHELVHLCGPRPWPQACDIIRQAANGLQHMHEMRLIHRDIKPANLLIGHDGEAKIIDFGLVLFDHELQDDEFSLVMIFGHDRLGTAEFSAPEQSRNSFKVDARADLFSLGCTLYFALTGQLPYPIDALRSETPPSAESPAWRERLPDIPPALVNVLDKLLAWRPEERYASAAELSAALSPLARPDSVTFDFDRLLDIRERSPGRGQTSSARNSSFTSRQTDAAPSRPHIPAMDTNHKAAREDTLLEEKEARRRATRSDTPRPSSPLLVAPTVKSAAAGQPRAWLQPLAGGHAIPLNQPQVTIGRDAANDIVLPSSAISSEHAALLLRGNRWLIVDLDSKNGIEVNGERVARHWLAPGDRISIARLHAFEFRDAEGQNVVHRLVQKFGTGGLAALAIVILALLLLAWIWQT